MTTSVWAIYPILITRSVRSVGPPTAWLPAQVNHASFWLVHYSPSPSACHLLTVVRELRVSLTSFHTFHHCATEVTERNRLLWIANRAAGRSSQWQRQIRRQYHVNEPESRHNISPVLNHNHFYCKIVSGRLTMTSRDFSDASTGSTFVTVPVKTRRGSNWEVALIWKGNVN